MLSLNSRGAWRNAHAGEFPLLRGHAQTVHERERLRTRGSANVGAGIDGEPEIAAVSIEVVHRGWTSRIPAVAIRCQGSETVPVDLEVARAAEIPGRPILYVPILKQ
jgi:hypothetical protein